MPRKARKFERCVTRVRRRGGVVDPAAVCAASLRRTGWKPGRKGGQINPAEAAAELSEAFHGRPPESATQIDEDLHYHGQLAGLGELEEIELEDGLTLDGFQGAILASNEAGSQLFISGGDQQVSLRRFPNVDATKERVLLGRVARIVYVTAKYHLGKQDRKTGPYEHELGEESGELPYLEYDTVNARLSFVGGAYRVEPEGVVD